MVTKRRSQINVIGKRVFSSQIHTHQLQFMRIGNCVGCFHSQEWAGVALGAVPRAGAGEVEAGVVGLGVSIGVGDCSRGSRPIRVLLPCSGLVKIDVCQRRT
jgi:hypothetical protein